jgi:hypothetical protein
LRWKAVEEGGSVLIDPNALRDIALRAAARSEDASPTGIFWVEAGRVAIAELIGWGLGEGEDGSRRQILLMVTGRFTLNRVPRPQGATSPTGTALTMVLNEDLSVTDFGCNRLSPTLLEPLGRVYQIDVS